MLYDIITLARSIESCIGLCLFRKIYSFTDSASLAKPKRNTVTKSNSEAPNVESGEKVLHIDSMAIVKIIVNPG
jgi:hypothetical protein